MGATVSYAVHIAGKSRHGLGKVRGWCIFQKYDTSNGSHLASISLSLCRNVDSQGIVIEAAISLAKEILKSLYQLNALIQQLQALKKTAA
ncbi:MAG: hypothetical protein EBQ96_07315 [Proteobacteria bacterium]|nr:hypothetical protein [Pseudomonadota bacterium]